MTRSRSRARQALALAVLLLGISTAHGADVTVDASDRLADYPQLRDRLAASPFGQPLHVVSEENAGVIRVDVHGLFPHPFAAIAEALTAPAGWCEFTPLHIGIAACTYRTQSATSWLTFYLRGGLEAPIVDGYAWHYRFHVQEHNGEYVSVLLEAATGPLDTQNYRILLEAVPVESDTLIRVRASYEPSAASRLILATYTGTIGRFRVGFSVTGLDKNRKPIYVHGRKALFERTVMRGYLALEAFLDTLQVPEVERFETRLARWLELSQRYPRQLSQPTQEDYLRIKRAQRQQQLKLQAAP